MTSFTADWLALREPADRRARNPDLLRALIAWRRTVPELTVVDLGAGTGAAVRDLAPHLGGKQAWLLLDNDAALLDQVAPRTDAWARARGWHSEALPGGLRVTGPGLELSLRTRSVDLNERLEPVDFAANGLVAASALLDLVSARWLADLAARCRELEAVFYASLSYDGRIELSPSLALDQTIRDLVNRHQTSDKAFGAALGPGCIKAARHAFAERGYSVQTVPSDWRLDHDDQAVLEQLFRGWADASAELRADLSGPLEEWLAQRLAQRHTQALVGHRDLLARPRTDVN